MKGPEADRLRIQHILDAISEVESYLKNVSLKDFLANSEKRFATTWVMIQTQTGQSQAD
jgi:uncharacterized protein with HEPN domain